MTRDVTFADVDHADHLAEVAREKVRSLKRDMLLKHGWKEKIVKSHGYVFKAWFWPASMNGRPNRFGRPLWPYYRDISMAFERLRRHLRRRCSPSCERSAQGEARNA